jgi:transcription initiation factor TFIIIB Brf1 subunit/transcription initiation factor TFIIB
MVAVVGVKCSKVRVQGTRIAMAMRRIQVYANEEVKRRIEVAAAKRSLPVTAYCLEAIVQQLGEDEVLEEEQIEIAVELDSQRVAVRLVAEMRALRERIQARRGGELVSFDIVERVRAEREEELHESIADLR